ncbi:MAG: cell division protein FtsQ [Sphingobacteriales bacterium]|jgi:cell division protein FtsQ
MKLTKKDVRFAAWVGGVLLLGLVLSFGTVPEHVPQWEVRGSEAGFQFFEPQKVKKELEQCGVCSDPYFVEEEFKRNPWCKGVNVHKNPEGGYEIYLEEELPVLRLLSLNVYLAETGKFLPIEDGKNYRVPVVTGVLPNRQDVAFWDSFQEFGVFLSNNAFWNAQIQQLIVDKNQEVVLIPRVGNHSIVLGTCAHAKEKLEKLLLLYKEGFSYTGWYNYREINIALSNQIVCTKR